MTEWKRRPLGALTALQRVLVAARPSAAAVEAVVAAVALQLARHAAAQALQGAHPARAQRRLHARARVPPLRARVVSLRARVVPLRARVVLRRARRAARRLVRAVLAVGIPVAVQALRRVEFIINITDDLGCA